jgi:hypothetical protein
MQMSSEDRSRIKPPRLHVRYDTRRLASDPSAPESESTTTGTTTFAVRYLNSAAVQGQFHNAWSVCMGIFVSIGLLCGLIQSLKWKVRSKATPTEGQPCFCSQLHRHNVSASLGQHQCFMTFRVFSIACTRACTALLLVG